MHIRYVTVTKRVNHDAACWGSEQMPESPHNVTTQWQLYYIAVNGSCRV